MNILYKLINVIWFVGMAFILMFNAPEIPLYLWLLTIFIGIVIYRFGHLYFLYELKGTEPYEELSCVLLLLSLLWPMCFPFIVHKWIKFLVKNLRKH